MSGNRYLLDTNCIIEILQNDNQGLLNKLKTADYVGASIISKIEFLAFPNIGQKDKDLFNEFLKLVDVVDLQNDNNNLLNYSIEIRQAGKMKLPDAIILATTKFMNAILLTRDKQLLNSLYDFVETF